MEIDADIIYCTESRLSPQSLRQNMCQCVLKNTNMMGLLDTA